MFQLNFQLFQCIAPDLGGHQNVSCIQVPLFNRTARDEGSICNFVRGNKQNRGRVLFVSDSDRSLIGQHIDQLMCIIYENCYFETLNLDIESLLKVERRWLDSSDVLISDSILCENKSKANSKIRDLVQAFRGRMIVFDVKTDREDKSNRNERFGMDFGETMRDDLTICETTSSECFGEPISTISTFTVTARKFEPFTITDKESKFSRGIEIMSIESIARKMNFQIHYNSENSTHLR